MASNILGLLATMTAAAISPLQLIALLRASDRRAAAKSMSVATVLLLCICNTCWFIYGILHGALWSAVLAAITIIVEMSLLVLCWRVGRVHGSTVLGTVVVLVCVGYIACHVPAEVLGGAAAAMSMANYVPAMVHRLRDVHGRTQQRSVYSVPMGLTMMTTNVLWVAYAVTIQDVWVGTPCVVNFIAGVVFVVVGLRQRRVML
jgi:uncharacterized protein with PQ loop repeat